MYLILFSGSGQLSHQRKLPRVRTSVASCSGHSPFLRSHPSFFRESLISLWFQAAKLSNAFQACSSKSHCSTLQIEELWRPSLKKPSDCEPSLAEKTSWHLARSRRPSPMRLTCYSRLPRRVGHQRSTGSRWQRVAALQPNNGLSAHGHPNTSADSGRRSCLYSLSWYLEMDDATQKALLWSPDAKTTRSEDHYFITSPIFETGSESLKQMEQSLFIGHGH